MSAKTAPVLTLSDSRLLAERADEVRRQTKGRFEEVMESYEDPTHENNGPEHYSGKSCVEKGCDNPAGTAWSPHWCQMHNAERINRISKNLREIRDSFKNS